MVEIVSALGLVRDPRYLYFVRGDHVWRLPRSPGERGTPEQVAAIGQAAAPGYVYFLDGDGHVARVPRPTSPPAAAPR